MSTTQRRSLKRAAAGVSAGVLTLSGFAAIATPATAQSNFSLTRESGADRYATAAKIATSAFGTADNVLVASGEAGHFADALTGNFLAGSKGAPVLLTAADTLPQATKDGLAALKAKNVTILGGKSAVSQGVEDALTAAGYTVTRIGGDNRYATGQQVAEQGGAAGTTGSNGVTAIVASGLNFPDALVAGGLAYAGKLPVEITDPNTLSPETSASLTSKAIKHVLIVGGTSAVSQNVEDAIKAKSITVTRLQGTTRQATAVAVANYATSTLGFSKALVNLATGADFPDALTGGPSAGKDKAPLLLAVNANSIGSDTNGYLTANSSTLTGGKVFGGPSAVSETAVAAAQTAGRTAPLNQAYTITDVSDINNGNFGYADPAQAKQVVQKFASTDVFTVDGKSATLGVFTTSLSVGDTAQILKDNPAVGKTTFNLVNKTASDYNSGLVGSVNGSASFTIVEPVTGVVLNTVATGANAYTVYQVDGQAAAKTIFDAAINAGDTAAVTGTGADASNIRTINAANKTVSGQVANAGASEFSVKTPAGATLGAFTPATGDSLTVDGKAATVAAFNAAVSNGDTASYAKSGGIQTIALSNAAPTVVNAQVTGTTAAAGQLTSVTFVPTGQASQIVYSATHTDGTQLTVAAATTTEGDGTAAEVQTLTFSAAPFGQASTLAVQYNTGALALNGQLYNVAIPNTGTLATDKNTLAANIAAAIDALPGATTATVTGDATGKIYTVTYAPADNTTNVLAAVAVNPWLLTVDGALASPADVTAAVTLGDTVVYQAADAATATKRRLELTNTSYSGTVSPATNIATDLVGVYAAGSTTVELGTINYVTHEGTGLTGTAEYQVNGTVKTLSEFETSLNGIDTNALTGAIKVAQSGTKVIYTLTTAVK